MLPRKTRHLWYAFLVLLTLVCGTTALAGNSLFTWVPTLSVFDSSESQDAAASPTRAGANQFSSTSSESFLEPAAAPMFMTIIQNADEEVICSDNGFTIARFNLCGDSDNRTISLSGAFGSYQWQQLVPSGSCTYDVNEDCPPIIGSECNSSWQTVGTNATFTLNAASISAANGAEFRVRGDGGTYYYFKVKKSTITQTYVKRDFICGVPGRIQVTNLSSAYEFSVDSGSGFGPWQTSPIFDNLTPGTYIVKARLQNTPNTCEYPYEPIVIEQLDIDIDVTFVDAQCFGETGSITVNVGNVPGPYRYTLLDSNGVPLEFTTFIPNNPYTFAAVGFGTYSVQVETQQCTGDPGNGIPPPQQSLDTGGNPIVIGDGLSALNASTEVNESLSTDPVCGANDVDIIVRTDGGAGPYTFTVSDGGNSGGSYTGQTTYNVTSPGVYEFFITDANGCTTTATASVELLSPPDVTASGTDGDCNNGAQITVNIIDPRGYNLQFRADPADPWSANPVLTVPDGTYNQIQVLYEQGAFSCIYTLPTSVTVTNVGAISGNAVKIQDRICDGAGGVNGGIIEFQGPYSGGSGSGYEFSIDGVNFSTQETYTNLATGTYTPIIRDAGGCRLELTPITILDVDPPTDLDFAQLSINCTAGTTDVQLTPTSNAAIVLYEVISPVSINNGASDTFAGLNVNTSYTFRITDANGCWYEESFTPAVVSTIRARVQSGGDLRVCPGETDGSGSFLIDGFTNNYTYNINGGTEVGPQNDATVTLPPSGAGTYTITVTDADTGCQDTATLVIEEPPSPLSLTGNVTAMSCANGNIGRVVATASGGWGTYRYSLELPSGFVRGPKTGRTFGNLTQTGTYILSVEDAEGCVETFTFDLTPIDSPTIALDTGSSDYCYVPGTGATLAVTSTAGTAAIGTHQYRINGGALQGSPVFTGLNPGSYTIEVVDGNNCSASITATINNQLRASANILVEIPCGGADGEIQVSAWGGYLAGSGSKQYEVSSDNGATFGAPQPLVSNTFSYFTAVPGDYVFRITDNQGCVALTQPVTLNPPANIDPASVNVTPASCGQTDNGIVRITPDATSGIPPYQISFDGGPFGDQTVFSNLNAGQTYTYIVRDSRGCETVPASVTVPLDGTPPPDATVPDVVATCLTGVVEAGIQVTAVSGGTPEYTYILQDQFGVEIERIGPTASTSETFTAQAVGTYTVVTIDALGCRDEDVVEITQTSLDVVPDPVTAPTCDPGGFTNTVEIVGGVGPFLIRLANDPNPPVSPNIPPRRHTFNGLQFGVSYTVEVTDQGTGCIYLEEIDPIDGPNPLEVTATSTPGFCDANRFGQIIYNIDGFSVGANLLIELLNDDDGTRITLESPTGVSPIYSNSYETLPGNYQIIVTDLTNDCTDATPITIDQNLPAIEIVQEEPANCNAFGQFTVQGSGGDGGPYTFAYMDTGVVPTPGDYTTETTFVGPAGNYDVYVMDSSGCTSFAIATIINLDPDLPAPTFIVENQCDVAATSFDILVRMPSTVDTPRFTLNGNEQFGVINGAFWEYTFTVGAPGDYTVDVIDADGCTSQGVATVYEFLIANGGFSTEPSCNAADGEITISTTGGSGDFTFELRDGAGTYITDNNTGIFTGYAPGDYEVLVTDNLVVDISGNCTFLVDNIYLEPATVPVIDSVLETDISCNGADDGAIDVQLQSGTDLDSPMLYTLYVGGSSTVVQQNASGSFTGLAPGTYDVTVLSARNCEDRQDGILIEEPPVFSITASAPDFACEPGANRYSSTIITVTVADPGTPGYQYSLTGFENYQTGNTFEVVDNGSPQTLTVYAIDGNGCQDSFTLPVLNPPTDVVPTISVVSNLTCTASERIRVDVVGTTDFTLTLVNGPASVAPVTNSGGNSFVEMDLPVAGGYLLEITDNSAGCSYPLPLHEVAEPIYPEATISEASPVTCAVPGNDGALFIEVTDYAGVYNYEVFQIDNSGNRITPAVAAGSFDTANYPDLAGDPARISGLSAGNYIVDIVAVDSPGCPAESNLATVRGPNGPLTPLALEEGNVSCNDNQGIIVASASGGWDNQPYEFRLLLDDGSGTYNEVVAFSNNDRFENLSSGNYRVEVQDVEGCSASVDIVLDPIPPILVGIREPQALVCPGGNNAVLEAYDPASGDAITGIAGASGGVPGSGYIYQLIYLGSNDINDELSRSGLQSSPTFAGPSGEGYISTGWYAIEVSSTYDCVGITAPYFVNPPPPVVPNLVQIRAPGCGGSGQMRLSITNPEPGFDYEYRSVTAAPSDPYISMGAGITSVLINGGPGFYQFDVRKVSVANICDAVRGNGLTLIDAQDLDLVANLPDDISCANEIDGRIESFASGGVGDNQFILYSGDPGADPFNPLAGATVVRGPQPDGTFEGLPEGSDYYITVTSGTSCGDVEGPLTIVRPAQIVFDATSTPVSCSGENDGSITVEVTSGGEGLIQFAIAPNFNEFFSDPDTPGLYTFTDLEGAPAPGRAYDILIQDAQGCSELTTVFVVEPTPLTMDAFTTDETCEGFADGTAQITINGGTPFVDPATGATYFETSLNSNADTDFVRNDALFYDMLAGGTSYVVFVRDANGCTANIVFEVEIGVNLNAEAVPQYGCDGIFPNNFTEVILEDNNMLSEVLFALDPVDPADAITAMASDVRSWGDLPAGDHIVYLYHANGCTTFVEFTIDPYQPLTLDAIQSGPNEITATASGGFGGYEYFFNGESQGSNNIFNINFDATINIEVRDSQGCRVAIAFPFNFEGMVEFPNYFTPDGDGMNDEWSPLNREFFPNIEIIIYDRYGRVVAILDQVKNWDGNYNGKPVPTGDYWYVVNANDTEMQQYVGHFTLYR